MKNKTLSIEEANSKIYDFGSKDASDIIAKLNLQYGLGKIMWALKKRNIDTEPLMAVTTPDSGITRNKERWQAGFSYGCVLRWPSKEEAGRYLAFPQIKPNACGMLVAKINGIVDAKRICDKLHKIEKTGLEVKNTNLKLNVGVSNHFIELCKVSDTRTAKLKKDDSVVIIHTSPSEHIKDIYDFKAWERRGGLFEDSPFGKLLVLEDKVAEEYLKIYERIEDFSKRKRIALIKELFGEFETVSNSTHQGIFNRNEARLGLYKYENMDELFPVTFRWDVHVYLMTPRQNLNKKFIKNANYSSKTKDILTNLNMLPHGGGYEIPFRAQGWSVMQNGSKRLFINRSKDKDYIFTSPSEIPYYYRGLQIVEEIDKLKLGEMAAKLKQVYTLKY